MEDPEQDDWDDDEYNYYPEYNYNDIRLNLIDEL